MSFEGFNGVSVVINIVSRMDILCSFRGARSGMINNSLNGRDVR